MGCICSCLKQGTPIPNYGQNSAVLVSSVDARPSTHRTKIDCITVSDQQTNRVSIKKLGEDSRTPTNKIMPISELDFPRNSVSSVIPNQPGTPKRLRDVMYPEPNCRVIVRTLPPKPRQEAPASESQVRPGPKPTMSTPGTTVVGMRSVESFDKMSLTKKHGNRRGSRKPFAKPQGDIEKVAAEDARSERPRRQSAIPSRLRGESGANQKRKSLRPLAGLVIPTLNEFENVAGNTVLSQRSKSNPYLGDLKLKQQSSVMSKKDLESKHSSDQQRVFLETSDMKQPKIKQFMQHQTSLELFASSYWKDAPSLEAVDTQPKTPQQNDMQPQYVVEVGIEQASNPKYTNTVSLYPDSPNFPEYVKREESDPRRANLTKKKGTIPAVGGALERTVSGQGRPPSQVLGENLQVTENRIESSQQTGKFGLETVPEGKNSGVHSSGGTGDMHQSSSIQNVTFMQGPLAESGGSHGQPALSTFSFKVKPAD